MAFFVGLTISCNQHLKVDNSLPPKDRILGTWEVVKAEGVMDDLNVGTNYIFDGTKMTTSKGFEITGELIASDSTILWKLENMEMNYTYQFESNTLIIYPLNSGQKLYLEKR
jgi:hypothetical protein